MSIASISNIPDVMICIIILQTYAMQGLQGDTKLHENPGPHSG
jgi:hypothetical protein